MDPRVKEQDPNGLDQHAPGAKVDAGKPRPSLILRDMARAIAAVVEVATFGAKKYTDGGWVHVPNGISRYTDAMLRHYNKEAQGEFYDPDSNLTHQAHLAWNALARLELMLREREEVAEMRRFDNALDEIEKEFRTVVVPPPPPPFPIPEAHFRAQEAFLSHPPAPRPEYTVMDELICNRGNN
jgi:hypothetical protein